LVHTEGEGEMDMTFIEELAELDKVPVAQRDRWFYLHYFALKGTLLLCVPLIRLTGFIIFMIFVELGDAKKILCTGSID
jgi:hypothetical protein